MGSAAFVPTIRQPLHWSSGWRAKARRTVCTKEHVVDGAPAEQADTRVGCRWAARGRQRMPAQAQQQLEPSIHPPQPLCPSPRTLSIPGHAATPSVAVDDQGRNSRFRARHGTRPVPGITSVAGQATASRTAASGCSSRFGAPASGRPNLTLKDSVPTGHRPLSGPWRPRAESGA